MEPELTVLDSLRKAVEAMPDDVPLRIHLATLLLRAGQRDEGIRHLGAVLQRDPGNAQALGLLQQPEQPRPGRPGQAGERDRAAGPGQADGPGKADGPGQVAGPGQMAGRGQVAGPGKADGPGKTDGTGQVAGP